MAFPPLSRARPSVAMALTCLAAVHLAAIAQSHVAETAEYVLRASTVAAGNLPESMRQEHGIPSEPNTGVLNVTVQRKADGRLRNVPAQVDVRAHNLLGVSTPVHVREVVANGFVSYLAVYSFLPKEVLDFRITVRPGGSNSPIALEFRDRLSGGSSK